MKKILTLFALLIAFAVNGFAENYEVVGAAIVANGENWNNDADANLMTTSDEGATYTLEITGVTLEAGTNYEYKIVEKGSWDEYFPNTGYNASFSVEETAVYTIKYVYTVVGSTCEVQKTKTGEAGQITHTYTVAGNSEALFGETWDPTETTNDMTESTTTAGLYTWSKENVALSATGETPIEFKVCVDHAWDVAYPSSNYQLNIAAAGNYNVTITYNSSSHDVNATATQIPNNYTATFDNGGGWTSVYAYVWSKDGVNITNKGLGDWPGTELTKTGDVYNVSIPSTVAPQYIIFHNNKGIQTADLDFVDGQAYTYTINLPGTVIWESDEAIEAAWYRDNYEIIIAKDKFANVKVGDKIHVAVQDVPVVANDWNAQVALKDGYWVDTEGAINVGGQNVEDASFIITGDMLTLFKERGMIVSGEKYSTKKVTVETTELTGSDLSIWVGPSSTSSVTISGNHFKNKHEWVYVGPQSWDYAFEGIQAGDVIRVSATATTEGNKWLVLSYSNASTEWQWVEYPDMSKTDFTGGFDFVIPEGNIDLIKENGIIVNQSGYTVTQVELITPNGNYYVIYDKIGDEDWMVDTTPMTPDEGTPTAYQGTISDVKFFAIAPNTALNATEDAIVNWAYVIHPNSNDDFLVEFKNYADEATGTSKVWKIADANDATVTINFTAATKAYTITNETTVAIGSTGYATYSNGNMYQVTGATANFVTVSGSEATLVPQDADAILPAMTGAGKHSGIVLTGTADSEATIKSVADDATAVDASANLLAGSGDDANGYDIPNPGKFDDTDFYTAYVLKEINSKVGFYKVNDTDRNLAAHKAFLAVPETSTAPAFIIIGGGEGTTGINDLRSLTEDASGNIYDLQGRRVENPTKGIYIVNGRKVVIK